MGYGWSSNACPRQQSHRPVLSGARVRAVCICLRDKGLLCCLIRRKAGSHTVPEITSAGKFPTVKQ